MSARILCACLLFAAGYLTARQTGRNAGSGEFEKDEKTVVSAPSVSASANAVAKKGIEAGKGASSTEVAQEQPSQSPPDFAEYLKKQGINAIRTTCVEIQNEFEKSILSKYANRFYNIPDEETERKLREEIISEFSRLTAQSAHWQGEGELETAGKKVKIAVFMDITPPSGPSLSTDWDIAGLMYFQIHDEIRYISFLSSPYSLRLKDKHYFLPLQFHTGHEDLHEKMDINIADILIPLPPAGDRQIEYLNGKDHSWSESENFSWQPIDTKLAEHRQKEIRDRHRAWMELFYQNRENPSERSPAEEEKD